MFRFSFIAFLFFCLSANAQVDRPTIGLVLSGGSAHGLAHIGVLQYLEERGVQVDYITGTSMGAVIGGLYAMGYTADQISNIAADLDWDLMMSNRSPLYEVSPAEKFFHEKIPISLLWNENAFKFPQGFIRGQKLDLLIASTFSPSYFIDNFDELPIPFRCVAVDLESGDIEVFNKGYLGDAVRASMAIPSVFPPKEINDRIYVDGGLIRNFPVEEIIEMGADIIIGVYVGSKKEGREELNSLLEILRQSASMSAILDSERQSKKVDILIEPDVKDLGTFDFYKYPTLITKGYRAAKNQEEYFDQLLDTIIFSPVSIETLKTPDSVLLSEIKTTAVHPVDDRMIRNKLNFEADQSTTLEDIEESIALVYGLKNFSKASYSFYRDEDKYGLLIDTKDAVPLTVGLNVNRFKYYNTSFILSGEARNLLGRPSRVRADLRLSENPGIQLDYLLRIPSSSTYYLNASFIFDRYELPFYDQNRVNRLYKFTEIHSSLSINKEWRNSYLFSLGYSYNYDFFRPQVFREDDIRKYRTLQDQFYVQLTYDDLDRTVFPDEGMQIKVKASGILNNRVKRLEQSAESTFFNFPEDRNYAMLDLSGSFFLHSPGIICHELYLKSSISTGQSFARNYKIGGPIQEKGYTYGFLGVDDSEFIVGNHISLKYGLRLHFKPGFYLSPAVQYLYGKNFLSHAFDQPETISTFSYGIIGGLDLPLGPVIIDVGITDHKEKLVLNFGIGFRHIY